MATQSSFKNMSLCLLVICFVCSALLAAVYVITEKPIKAAQEAILKDAIAAVAPEFDTVSDLQSVNAGDKEYTYYTLAKDGQTVAYAVNTSATGFGGAVKLMVGFTPDGVIYNTSVLDCSNETPGLGAKCTEPSFKDQFKGFDPAVKTLVVSKDGGDVDGITAATITSRAYTKAVAGAVEAFKAIAPAAPAEEETPAEEIIDGGQEND